MTITGSKETERYERFCVIFPSCLALLVVEALFMLSNIAFVQTRKPLVEKKRRARINESLQELRLLLTDSDVSCVLHFTNFEAYAYDDSSLFSITRAHNYSNALCVIFSRRQRWRTLKSWK